MSKNKLALIVAGAAALAALAVPFAVQAASAQGSGSTPASSDPAPGSGDGIVGVEPTDGPAQSRGYWTDERLDQARPYDPMPQGDPAD